MPRTSLHVNGRFLVQPMSGVQRYARELLTAFDRMLAADNALAARFGPIPVWYPVTGEKPDRPDWTVLHPMPLPGGSGHFWEQHSLQRCTRDGVLLSLCGSGPLRQQRQVLAIHDANIWAIPQAFSPRYRLFHRWMRPRLAKRVRGLVTVSDFSAQELARHLGVPAARFAVIPNSAEHILSVPGDPGVLGRLGLKPGGYLLAAGNHSRNKNLDGLSAGLSLIGASALPLVMAGGPAQALASTHPAAGVIAAGRVSDGELRALYEGAAAFVWPSFYEGFGIPPLEAMQLGVPVLSSSTTAMPEVLGDAPIYFDPRDAGDIARSLRGFFDLSAADRRAMGKRGRERARMFRWDTAATLLHNAIGQVL